ncbi:hypothetical protein [Marinospirillum insulare]|uniref:Lipoprotein n=1 Tax=Marinospirillum insulare TaxID=217169 RepID=A0ABQ5ZTB5_9GAMM|nr:hypothetical protein [Marinospirillum insulare]GLR63385.1 hypothetical protein GCM10007878_08200 [Marinospirillum insulare]
MKTLKTVLVLAALLVFAGCSTNARLGQFTAASSMNVRNMDYSIENQTEAHVKGESCFQTITFFTLGNTDDRLQRAMDDAIQKGRKNVSSGDLLVNVRINMSSFNVPFYHKNCYEVEGDLVSLDK